MISNFPKKKAYNPGGYTSFFFLPFNEVATFPMIVNGVAVVPVGLKNGAKWRAGYATPETLLFEEEGFEDANGPFYLPIITGFVPGDKPALISLIQSLEKVPCLVILRDSLGKMRLVGSVGCPLTLTSKEGSGSKRSDSKGLSFKFAGQALYRAPQCTM